VAAVANLVDAEYRRLFEDRPPMVIKSEAQRAEYLAVANALIDKGDAASAAELLYLELLSVLLATYENQCFSQKSTPADRLRELLRAHNMKPSELCEVFGSRGTVYEVLSGKRTISKRVAKDLAERFSVPVDIFI